MNVIKCTKCNLHYDADKYSTCPHCIANGHSASHELKEKDTDITKKSKRGFFGKKEKFDEDNVHTVMANSVSKTWGAFDSYDDDEASSDDYDKTECHILNVSDRVAEAEVSTDLTKGQEEHDVSDEDTVRSHTSLTEEIKNITKNNTGRTLGYFNLGDSDEATNHTLNIAPKPISNKVQTSPVVGWLVCTKGKHMGESFQLFDGNNSIGRDNSNDVVLFREQSVSSNKHAIITYNPRKRVFFVQAGDSHGLTYLNDEMVMGSQEIKIYDLIEFGENAAFVFVPLCGEKFSWEEFIGR